MDIQYSKRAIKAINSMDKPTKQRIRKAIEGLPKGDIKTLQGAENSYRLRGGDWRILFSYLETETGKGILIEKVAPRGEIYKGV